ncbi:hypothetical protein [Lacimicrobium alkaliphilum]|nr:hypothetical protein [Lacimicrobium alkaliphilum]
MSLKKMLAEWQKCIAASAAHSAFTDLCEFNQQLYCCFREATDHVSADGQIGIVQLNGQGEVTAKNRIRIPDTDLRDPKLSITPDNKLLLLAYGRFKGPKGRYSQPLSWFSCDGQSWSSAKPLADKNWWLWRLSWHQGTAYGVAYNRAAQQTRLYAGNPRRTFECINQDLFSLSKNGKGYPNETDMFFDDNGNMVILLRRDADTCTAQLGVAKPPYRRWQWTDLGVYIGGPAMLAMDNNQALVSGRVWTERGPKTALLALNLSSKKLRLLTLLPSAGDTSYPGMVLNQEGLYISYYSTHEHKTMVYLTRFKNDELRALNSESASLS